MPRLVFLSGSVRADETIVPADDSEVPFTRLLQDVASAQVEEDEAMDEFEPLGASRSPKFKAFKAFSGLNLGETASSDA